MLGRYGVCSFQGMSCHYTFVVTWPCVPVLNQRPTLGVVCTECYGKRQIVLTQCL